MEDARATLHVDSKLPYLGPRAISNEESVKGDDGYFPREDEVDDLSMFLGVRSEDTEEKDDWY